MADGTNVGRIVEIKGVVLDAVFDGKLPAIYNALHIPIPGVDRILVAEVQQHLGDDRVRAVAMDATEGLARGNEVIDTGAPISVPVGDVTLGRIFNVLGEAIDKGEEIPESAERWSIHRAPPLFEDLEPKPSDPRDRHQGHRPARAVHARRQDRPVRRRRRRQDGADPGADQQHREVPRRQVGVRRRRRAHPRGQRPLARDDRVGRDRPHRARVRPDERAAGSASARRPVGPDDGGVLPRHRGRRRPALHRQHLPLHAGRLRGLGPARPHAERGRLPAHAGDRDGRAAGAHHVDQPRLPSPRCRPSTCPPTT